MEAAVVAMAAVGMAVADGTVAAAGTEAVVGAVAVVGVEDIGGEAVDMAGGPDTGGAVIPTTLTIPIILGVINPVSAGVFLTEDHEGH
jgi:hypothetical protein